MISAEAGDWLKKHRRENPPAWVHEPPERVPDEWAPDEAADEKSARYERDHAQRREDTRDAA